MPLTLEGFADENMKWLASVRQLGERDPTAAMRRYGLTSDELDMLLAIGEAERVDLAWRMVRGTVDVPGLRR